MQDKQTEFEDLDVFGFKEVGPHATLSQNPRLAPSAHRLAFLLGRVSSRHFSTLDKRVEEERSVGFCGTGLFSPSSLPSSLGPAKSSFSQAATGSCRSYILHLKLIAEFYFIIQKSVHAKCIGLLFLPLAYLLDCYLGKIVKNVYSYPENYSYSL